jgi:lysophospholipase L1-like esterase
MKMGIWFFFSLMLLNVSSAVSQASDTLIQINFVVHIGKQDQPTDGRSIFISGNHKTLGLWKPDGFPLTPGADSTYVGEVRVPSSSTLELKLTQGSWERVEVSRSGDSIQNRKVQCSSDCTIELYPEGFLDPASPWEFEIRHFEEMDTLSPPAPHPVVFVGSSSIRFWSTLKSDFPLTAPLNRGFGGAHISDLILYYNRIISVYQPSQVVIYIGENDLMNGVNPSQLTQLIWDFKERIEKDFPLTQIYVTTLKPSPALRTFHDQIIEVNNELKNWPARDSKITFVDVYDAMLDSRDQIRPELFIADGLHMNRVGYAIWAHIFSQYFN